MSGSSKVKRVLAFTYSGIVVLLAIVGFAAYPSLVPVAGVLAVTGGMVAAIRVALAAAPRDPSAPDASPLMNDPLPPVDAQSEPGGKAEPEPPSVPMPAQLSAAYLVMGLMVLHRFVAAVIVERWALAGSAVLLVIAMLRLQSREATELRVASFICFATVAVNALVVLVTFLGATFPPNIWPILAFEGVYLLMVFGGFLLLESQPVQLYFDR